MIIVYFGSRPTAESGDFPHEHHGVVHDRLERMIAALGPRLVVGSAAPGADLLALTVAASQQIARVVVIAGTADAFFETAVANAGAPWAGRYRTGLSAPLRCRWTCLRARIGVPQSTAG